MSSEKAQPAPGPVADAPAYKVWLCVVCGFVYNERDGWPAEGIPPGTPWEDIPDDWLCPDCGAGKSNFEMIEI
jgi:rubredoxin